MKNTKFFNKVKREWVLIDAKDKVIGRLSTRIARILQGKDKPVYTPNLLSGSNVIVINAKFIRITGNKTKSKTYDRYSGYPGGIKEITFEDMMDKNPTRALYLAVRGMLPKTMLGKKMIRGLKIYPEAGHKQTAQLPKTIEV